MARRLPATGENLFQRIKRIRNEYERRTGNRSVNLSVGEPDGVPTEITRSAAAVACMSTEQRMHVYQDNGEPEGFSRKLVGYHLSERVLGHPGLKTLPLPGIKPMIGLLPLACGANREDSCPCCCRTTKPDIRYQDVVNVPRFRCRLAALRAKQLPTATRRCTVRARRQNESACAIQLSE